MSHDHHGAAHLLDDDVPAVLLLGRPNAGKSSVYNRLTVTGVPVGQLRPRIVEFLQNFEREPLVEVEPLLRITVNGEVRSPNTYLFGPEVSVAEAIARAGGATADGKMSRVVLERDGERRTLDLSSPSAQIEGETIRSGDRITVNRGRQLLRDVVGPAASIASTIVSLLILVRR